MARPKKVTFKTEDGLSLVGTLFEPEGPVSICVLINSATGAPRTYYENFALFLTENGLTVLTYDYRGLFDSAQTMMPYDADYNPEKSSEKDPENEKMTMRNWGEQDTEAALNFLRDRFPECVLTFVGHSIGGTLLGLAPSNRFVQSAVAIASPSGHWGHWPFPAKLFAYFAYTIFVPVVVALRGNLPAHFLGIALPSGIALEWARWCSNPNFVVDKNGQALHDGFAQFTGSYLFYSTIDDIYAPPDSVRALGALFKNARVEYRVVTAREWQVKSIGHFGFFRKTAPIEFWQVLAQWQKTRR